MPQNNRFSRSPFRHRDFRIFWAGSFFSSIGTQFTTVAMAWQIYELTNSPFQIGLLGLARALPQMVLLLFAGLLADAVNRRKLMICTQSGLCCVSAALAILTFSGKASPHMLYIATVFLAVCTSMEQPSRDCMQCWERPLRLREATPGIAGCYGRVIRKSSKAKRAVPDSGDATKTPTC